MSELLEAARAACANRVCSCYGTDVSGPCARCVLAYQELRDAIAATEARLLPLGHAFRGLRDERTGVEAKDGPCWALGYEGCGEGADAHEPQPFGWAVLCADGDTHSLTRVLQRADTIMRDLDTAGSPVATECGPHVRSPLYADPTHDPLRERLRALVNKWRGEAVAWRTKAELILDWDVRHQHQAHATRREQDAQAIEALLDEVPRG